MMDRHVEMALAALDDVSLRELEAVAEKLTRRRDGLREFGIVLGDVASGRRGAFGGKNSKFHLETAIARVDEGLAEKIEAAEAPFWGHVHDAVEAYQDEKSAA